MERRLNTTASVLVYGIAVVSTLAYGTVHQPAIALIYILCCTAVLFFSASAVVAGSVNISRSLLLLPLPLLAAYAVLQVIPFGTLQESGVTEIARTISQEPFATQTSALHIAFIAIFAGLAFSCIDSAKRLNRIVAALTVFGFIYAFYAILQSVLSPDKIYGIYDPRAGSPFGSFVNKHDYAAMIELVSALPMGMLFAGSLRRDKWFLYITAVGLMGASLILSGSRGGLVALIAQISFLIILSSKSKGPGNLILKTALSLFLIGAAVGGAIFVGGDTTLTRISDTAASGDVTSNRSQIWETTLNIVRDNWLFGVGIGAFPQAYTRYDSMGGYERVEQAHNDYLQLVSDAGVPGLLIGILFLAGFARSVRKGVNTSNGYRRGIALGAAAGCFGVLVHSLFDFVLHITAVSLMFSLVLACLVAAGRNYSDDIEDLGEGRKLKRRSGNVTAMSPRAGTV